MLQIRNYLIEEVIHDYTIIPVSVPVEGQITRVIGLSSAAGLKFAIFTEMPTDAGGTDTGTETGTTTSFLANESDIKNRITPWYVTTGDGLVEDFLINAHYRHQNDASAGVWSRAVSKLYIAALPTEESTALKVALTIVEPT